MFPRKMFVFIGVAVFIVVNLTVLSMARQQAVSGNTLEDITISFISPFQWVFTQTIRAVRNVWKIYFASVQAARENTILHSQILESRHLENTNKELSLENQRLKKLLNFSLSVPADYVAARVVGRDPSPWFQTIVIDRGQEDGVHKQAPVVVAEGIVGKVISAGSHFSKVLLITDRSSAVDSLVQDSRVRGMVRGENNDQCVFIYVLRKDSVHPGQTIVSSGLDQIFPKGLVIGRILDVKREQSHLFQNIAIETSVDFDRLEEVLVMKKIQSVELKNIFQ